MLFTTVLGILTTKQRRKAVKQAENALNKKS
jgi:hypothetical protein